LRAAAGLKKTEKQKKHLPRNDTEKHGRSRSRDTEKGRNRNTEGKPSMDPRIREDDKSAVQSLKVQMERLQWGFPIATALSLNTPASINRKKKKEAEALATD
jgi:hypothetical protein